MIRPRSAWSLFALLCAFVAFQAMSSCKPATKDAADERRAEAKTEIHPREELAQWIESEACARVRSGRLGEARTALSLLSFLAGDARAGTLQKKIRAAYAHRANAMRRIADDAESAGDERTAVRAAEAAARAARFMEAR